MDEVQYALHRSLIKVKSFSDPELHAEFTPKYDAWIANSKEGKEPEHPLVAVAEKWMEENPIDGLYSAVGHTAEGVHYVTLPNTVSEIILEAIDKTVKEFNVRVPLGIEWITGKNWYNCH